MQDTAAVCGVLDACFAPEWTAPIRPDVFRRVLRNSPEWDEAKVHVGVLDGHVCGFGAVVITEGSARIPYLHVHPEFRGRGVGNELLQDIELFCDGHDCTDLSLGGFTLQSPFHGVDARDSEAASFLQRRGYSEHFRAATRAMRLPSSSLESHDAEHRNSRYRFDLVSDSHPDYWDIRNGSVDLCRHVESIFAVFAKTYEGRQVHKDNAYIAAARKGLCVVGFAGFLPFQDAGIGYDAYPQWGPLLVHPGHRGQGIARRLLRISLARMAELGCERVVLGGTGVTGPAAHLYESVGFETVVNWIEYWKEKEDNREQAVPHDD